MQHKLQLLLTLSIGALWGCSGSGSSGGSGGTPGLPSGFQLVSISVRDGETWPINRAIQMEFSQAVDFSSITSTTIHISSGTLSATGTFSQRLLDTDADGVGDTVDPTTILWQPACPLRADFSDAGLRAGGFDYQINIIGRDRSIDPVKAINGTDLRLTQSRVFNTPISNDSAVIFLDPMLGSPVPVVRAQTSTQSEGVCYIEIGGNSDVNSRIYFERALGGGINTINPGPLAPATLPLNLYSDASTELVFVLFFNQPVNPSSVNISGSRLRIEYRTQQMVSGSLVDTWVPIETDVELVTNCLAPGAEVRLRPLGGLPAGAMVRAVMRAGFEGLVGNTDSAINTEDRFAVAPTMVINNASLIDSMASADGLIEEFNLGGDGSGSRQDTGALTRLDPGANVQVVDAPALWGNGSLTSQFAFSGTGGASGTFDWYVNSGGVEIFDTSSQAITSGIADGGATQFTVGGVVEVRNLIIDAGSTLRVMGPNPLFISATGMVSIQGTLDLSGFASPPVGTINMGNIPTAGAAGIAGGGDGGAASRVTNNSTPRGSRGLGAFGSIVGGGGQGGESGGAVPIGGATADNRRPGGGAGGAFNVDLDDSSAELSFNDGRARPGFISEGMFAAEGTNGNALARGAESGVMPPASSIPGMGPFVDGDGSNNFFGTRADVIFSILADRARPVASTPTQIITGELSAIHAGAGGGGGGDALTGNFFPTPNWTTASDERGGGGGGGGGALHMRVLGPIIMSGLEGQILCKGGRGGTGENSFAFDQVGGTGGSGSGGHVILETADYISFSLSDPIQRHLFIDARGARENRGRGRDGSAQNNTIPGGISDGGQGGAGLVQLHTPNSSVPPDLDLSRGSKIVLPAGTFDNIEADDANALNEIMRPAGLQMIPSFSSISTARSEWVDLGAANADLGNGAGAKLLQFLFDGINPADGAVLTTAGVVDELTPLLGPDPLSSPQIQAPNTLVLSGTNVDAMIASNGSLGDDVYLRTPALLRNCLLRVTPAIGPPVAYNVEAATYLNAGKVLTLSLNGAQDLSDFIGQSATYTLIPRFFSVSTGGNINALPDGSELRLSFDLTGRNASGLPDENNILLEKTSDFATDINPLLMGGDARFFRINFEFDLDSDAAGLSSLKQPISLDFIRLPFSY